MNLEKSCHDIAELHVGIQVGGQNYVLFLQPYSPIAYPKGSAEIDAYYFVSNSLYHRIAVVVQSHAELSADVSIPYKTLLAESGICDTGLNTLCMTEQFGSRFVIGAVRTTENVEQKRNVCRKLCDGCGKCIAACPTGALTRDGLIREKCIRDRMENMNFDNASSRAAGMRLLGCDICQRACPRNAQEHIAAEGELAASLDIAALASTLVGGDMAFLKSQIGANYARRKKLSYLLINVIGNSGDSRYLPILQTLPAESEREVENKKRATSKLCSK